MSRTTFEAHENSAGLIIVGSHLMIRKHKLPEEGIHLIFL